VAAIAHASVQAAVEGLARKVFDDTYVRYKAQLGRSLPEPVNENETVGFGI
jgi:hypothetical protein